MKSFWERVDWMLIGAVAVLLVLSVLFVFSAGYREADQGISTMAVRQAVWALVGTVVFIAAAAFDYRKLKEMHWWIYAVSLALLVAVLFFGISIHGARRWFRVAGILVQPSELAKPALIVTLAAVLGDPATESDRLPAMALTFLLAGIPFALIAIEPDLGTAMVLLPVLVIMLFCAGCPLRPLLVLLGTGAILLVVMAVWLRFFPETCTFLSDYQKDRILVYLNMNQDPLGAGWNKLQSQIAVGSGGLLGKGYLRGTQNVLGFLPRTVAPTDFIYSVVAEETGFAGSSVLLALYTVISLRCMRAAVRARDLFGRLLATGIGAMLFTHIFINIAMTIGLMPITGLPLPLMSYGGSFMVSVMAALGLVQGVYIRRRV